MVLLSVLPALEQADGRQDDSLGPRLRIPGSSNPSTAATDQDHQPDERRWIQDPELLERQRETEATEGAEDEPHDP